jgi:hypothetical protein
MAMYQSPEAIARVIEWRAKAAAGTLTIDEMKAAVIFLRAERVAAPAGKPRAAKAAPRSADAMLADLDNL